MMTILVSALSAVCYRLGGIGKPFSGKIRDWGCSGLVIWWSVLYLPRVDWWWYLISFLLMWPALTTYHDYLGHDNFYLHGFFVGLALLPITYPHLWLLCLVRAVVLGACMGLWCKVFSNDWVEELGRGVFIGLSLYILRIPWSI